jgi:hypothetical protein
MLILFNAFAQPEEADKVNVSVNYLLSNINFSSKHMYSGSILIWRDIYLHGLCLNVNFPKAPFGFDKSNISAGFSSSFHGYHTDDDANNDMNVIYVATTTTTLLDLKYEVLGNKSMLNPKLGFDFNMLSFKNYKGRPFSGRPFRGWAEIEGLVSGYDIYKLGFYGGVQAVYNNKVIYLEASGQVGISFYSALANWVNRPDLKSPVSFLESGFSFRAGSDVEIGLKLDRLAFFFKVLLFHEINPGLGMIIHYPVDEAESYEFHFFDLSRASLSAGLKVSF